MAAVDVLPDQAIGSSDVDRPSGNSLVLRLAPDRYVLLAHLQRGSLRVDVGDRVAAGQPLAQVGNSGNTSEPHLHVQAMTAPEGGSPLRLAFDGVIVLRGGEQVRDRTLELRRNDRVLPAS